VSTNQKLLCWVHDQFLQLLPGGAQSRCRPTRSPNCCAGSRPARATRSPTSAVRSWSTCWPTYAGTTPRSSSVGGVLRGP
jgi:hypothetical protein